MYMCPCVLFKRDFKAWNNETWPVTAKHCLGTWFLGHSLTLNTYVCKTPSLQPLSKPAVFRLHPPFSVLFSCCWFPPLDTYCLYPLQGTPSLLWLLHGSLPQHRYCSSQSKLLLQGHKKRSEFIKRSIALLAILTSKRCFIIQ